MDRSEQETLRPLLLAALRESRGALWAVGRLTLLDAPGVVETLFDACFADSARVRAAALRAMSDREHPLVSTAFERGSRDASSLVRSVVIERAPIDHARLLRLAGEDPSNKNRALALGRLLDAGDRRVVSIAASDPHWRVRAALVPRLVPEDLERLRADDPRTVGVRHWLEGTTPAEQVTSPRPAWDDDDPAVARRSLEEGASMTLDEACVAVGHESAAVRALARDRVRAEGSAAQVARVLALDPRAPGAAQAFELLTRGIDEDRLEAAAALVETLSAPPPSRLRWARAYGKESAAVAADDASFWAPDVDLSTREAREAARTHADHRVRAAAVDTSWAKQALEDPCPRVWFAAADALRTHPERALAFGPASPPPTARGADLVIAPPDPSAFRVLGGTGLCVSPLGISGHYGLSVDGFAASIARGVNFFFWEPTYREQTQFVRRISPSLRHELVFAAGTFEASPNAMRADLERTLRHLDLDELDLFIVFWARSAERLRDDVRSYLESEVASGRIRAWGLSTHQRPLARWALDEGVDPLMLRFNAVHRGAETDVLPHVRGQGVLGFSNLLYGRLLDPGADGWRPEAWQCYRHVLDLKGITSTWTAPATAEQLEHNLLALTRQLTEEDRNRLRAHGARLHARETHFRRCVRAR